ncbi:MAG TPA: hypothetical protein VEU77_05795 [Candidatus Acidoferrales bacterium]|nr:hypothetical protein [Candidatus Acidoferrales bacterium]
MASRYPADDLEATLVDLGRHLAYPRPAAMAAAVRARLRGRPRPVVWWRGYALAPALITAVLLLIVVALGSPGVRAAAQDFLHIRGVDIFPVPSVPTLTPRPSASPSSGFIPGERVTLAEAQRRVHFTIRQPAELGAPDEIYVDSAERVTLVYRDRPGIPQSPATALAALVVEFPGTVDSTFFGKAIGPDTTLTQVTVNGTTGYWLEGAPHFFFYRNENGSILQETLRLAGNTLIWVENGVTLRIEANVSKETAVRIAESMR